jgi:hypothetical protein
MYRSNSEHITDKVSTQEEVLKQSSEEQDFIL